MDHELRRGRLAARLPDLEVDAVLVTQLPNVRYLTGFTGSNGQALLARGGGEFFTDGRYTEQSRREVEDLERTTYSDGFPEPLVASCRGFGVARLGFEAAGVTFELWERLRAKAEGIELVPLQGEVERLRWAKDGEELALLGRAQEAADRAFEDVVLDGLRAGMTERELAFDLELAMRRAGAEGLAFETIAAFGPNAAEPHHDPTDRPLSRGDIVKLDFGARVGGYHSDMTRTVALGEPDGRLREIHDVVATAHRAGVDAVRTGAKSADIDRAARDVVEQAGYGDLFTHGLGHGVGLEIHEGPSLRRDGEDVLPAEAVVTIEPGVYVPGLGGVRIEDMVEVTDAGGRVIPRSTRDLVVL